MSIQIDRPYLTALLAKLVQTDSRNPDLVPEAVGERRIGELAGAEMEALGLEVSIDELTPERVNVVGRLRGKGTGRSLMLNAHMDTVGVEGMDDPFSGAVKDGKLYGRGSQDMKGSLAAQIAAAKALIDANIQLEGDLLIVGVADEEYASIGTQDIVERYSVDAAIVTEPTDMILTRAHRGFVWFEVETIGRAAHGSRYEDGIDANMMMGRFLGELDQLARELQKRPAHPLTALPSLHAATIHGGSAISVYAASCVLQVERRLIPGETPEQAEAELRVLLQTCKRKDASFNATLKQTLYRAPFEVAEDAAVVSVVDSVLRDHTKSPKPHQGVSFWTDAAFLAAAGVETVVLGPVGAGLHSDVEWVDLASVEELALVLAETARRYCGER